MTQREKLSTIVSWNQEAWLRTHVYTQRQQQTTNLEEPSDKIYVLSVWHKESTKKARFNEKNENTQPQNIKNQ
jgi:hypothetical protein